MHRGGAVSHHMCTDTGQCACEPGLIACGKKCVDLESDPKHCGACNSKCVGNATCNLGICEGTLQKKDPPFEIDGSDATTTRVQATEAYPEQPFNPPGPNPAFLYAGFQDAGISGQDGPFNWSPSNQAWNSPAYEITHPIQTFPFGDSWATTSPSTGLEYVSNIFNTLLQPSSTGLAFRTPTWPTIRPSMCWAANISRPIW